MAPPFLDPDAEQRQVLEHPTGSLLVLGAAGTGKTAVLRERFARLILEGADPERTALVVRSRHDRAVARAAILERLRLPLPNLRVFTVQALALHVVEQRFPSLGLASAPLVLSAADQFAKVRELLVGENGGDWPVYGTLLGLRGFADQVRQLVIRAQEALFTPEEMLERAGRVGLVGWRELALFYRRYLDRLGAEGAVDFAGLVGLAADAAEGSEPSFDHLLVDDLQDSTLSTERLLLSLRTPDLVVAGHPEAHVFSFQGTTDVPLDRFADRFAADRLELLTDHRSSGRALEAWSSSHTSEEHAAVARELRRIHVEERVPWNDLAVVVRRQGEHVAGLLRALDDAGVPRAVPEAAFTLPEEPAVLPYVLALRWLARPDEREVLVASMLTSGLVGLSPAAARGALRVARAQTGSAASALEHPDGIAPDEQAQVQAVREALAEAGTVAERSVQDAFRILWQRLPCSRALVERGDPRALDAVVALTEAVVAADGSADPSVAAFVDALGARADGLGLVLEGWWTAQEGVRVLTAHGAVGREFDTVVVTGAVEGDFPSLARPEPMFDLAALEGPRSQSERNRLRLRDERRLFGTVLARARRRVLFTASDPHGAESQPGERSRFVAELEVPWRPAPIGPFPEPVSVAEAAATWRRALSDPTTAAPERLAGLDGLLALGGDPRRWWFQREWTGGDRPLHEHVRVSASRLETLENCGLQFVLREELGLGRPFGYHAWVGKLVHRLIEECEDGAIPRNLDALAAAAEERWRPEEFPSYAVSEAYRSLVKERMLPNWFGGYASRPALATEIGFEFEYDGATVIGYIDRIGQIAAGGNKITDYKTGNPDRAPDPAQSLQLGIYYLAAHIAPDLEPYRPVRGVELAYLKGHWRTAELVHPTWQVPEGGEADEAYQAAMRERLSGLIERVRDLNRTGRYRPTSTAECWGCDFKTLCTIQPEGRPLFPAEEP